MTPDELNAVKAAWEQREIISIVLAAVGAGSISVLGAYLTEKGKNRALREDLEELTRKVESVKSEIASKQHFSRFRYELEVGLYKDFWKKLFPMYEQAMLPPSSDRQARAATLNEAHKQLFEAVRDNIPFYPTEIWDRLRDFSDTCILLASAQTTAATVQNQAAFNQLSKRIEELQAKAKDEMAGIEKALRERVQKFDLA